MEQKISVVMFKISQLDLNFEKQILPFKWIPSSRKAMSEKWNFAEGLPLPVIALAMSD